LDQLKNEVLRQSAPQPRLSSTERSRGIDCTTPASVLRWRNRSERAVRRVRLRRRFRNRRESGQFRYLLFIWVIYEMDVSHLGHLWNGRESGQFRYLLFVWVIYKMDTPKVSFVTSSSFGSFMKWTPLKSTILEINPFQKSSVRMKWLPSCIEDSLYSSHLSSSRIARCSLQSERDGSEYPLFQDAHHPIVRTSRNPAEQTSWRLLAETLT
jgi:hypothetical protein